MTAQSGLAEESSQDGRDELLLQRLQSRSDDQAAWEAAVEVFRRAGTEDSISLPDGCRSDRPEVKAIIEAAAERQHRRSPHWPLSRLLTDSREYVRLGCVDLLAEIQSDMKLASSERQKANDCLRSLLDHECRDTRLRAAQALLPWQPGLGAPVAIREFKASLRKEWWFWAAMLVLQGTVQLAMAGMSFLWGEPQWLSRLIIALLMLIPGILVYRAIPYFTQRGQFLQALTTLEQVAAISPEDAKCALADLDMLAQAKTSDDVRGRAKRLSSAIRNASAEGLPIAVSSPAPSPDALPRPAEEPPSLR